MNEYLRIVSGGEPAPATHHLAPGERDPLVDVANPRHRQALELLEAGYERATTADGFRAYLNVVAHLWHYSPRNVGLIYAQRPDATMVASYRRWQAMNRQVQKGEQGIRVFYPYRRKERDPVSGEEHEVVAGFGIGTVFDVSQTQGEPIPDPPSPSDRFGTSDVGREVYRRMALFAIGNGWRVEKKNTGVGFGRGPRGYCKEGNQIVIADFLEGDDGEVKTFAHELSHVIAGHHEQGDPWEDKARKELEAEGSAFAALLHFGIDTADYSFPYLATWGKGQDAMRHSLPEIARVTRTLVSAIEGESPDGEEEWL